MIAERKELEIITTQNTIGYIFAQENVNGNSRVTLRSDCMAFFRKKFLCNRVDCAYHLEKNHCLVNHNSGDIPTESVMDCNYFYQRLDPSKVQSIPSDYERMRDHVLGILGDITDFFLERIAILLR